ncbi:DUF1289 domain-containing protein [Alteromonas flava]|uniref:DUF1289 domain-containing protein n=1 Tax=Alteromonas flava TaxID=2048003 RepID=UPI000C28FDE2|nr:DUF1289 domain-containing protein [Alteromonas flava]
MSSQNPNPQLQQIEMFSVPSPCIGVCEANQRGFCKGCFRSREERLYWTQISDAAKRIILQNCKRRASASLKRSQADIEQAPEQSDLFGSGDQSQ